MQQLDDNGTGINACIGHITGDEASGVPGICMGDGPAGVSNSSKQTNILGSSSSMLSCPGLTK